MTNLILHMTLPETWDDEPGMIVSTKLAKIAVPSLDTTIQELKSLIEETYKVPANRLEVIFDGQVVSNDSQLSTKGIANESVLYIYTSKPKVDMTPTPKPSKEAIERAYSLYKMTGLIETKMKSLDRATLNKILLAVPKLNQDIGAVSLLKDFILIDSLQNEDIIHRIAEEYPILIEESETISRIIRTYWFDDMSCKACHSDESLSDASSDGDEPVAPRPIQPPRHPAGLITSNDLAQALNLFQNAMQASRNPQTPAPQVPPAEQQSTSTGVGASSSTTSQGYGTQLNTMHEMGLLNDAGNIQALVVTNGDVQAAIDLVLSDPDYMAQ